MPAPRGSSRTVNRSEELAALAPVKPLSEILSLDKYYRSADLCLAQAQAYRASRNEEQLYVMLLRYASLIIETVPQHKDFRATHPKYVELKKKLPALFDEMADLKRAINLKQLAQPPVAHSTNRPSDAVALSTSNLTQMDWGPSAPPMPTQNLAPILNVNDLLDIMSGSSRSAAPTAPPPPPFVSSFAPSASQYSSTTAAPLVQPKYAIPYSSPSYATYDKHSLFGRSNSGRYTGTSTMQQQHNRTTSRYPALESGAILPPNSTNQEAVDLAQLSVSGDLQQQQQQMMALAGPMHSPQLGPQELPVHIMDPGQQGLPPTCAMHAPPEGSGPTAAAMEGGPKELGKKAQLRDVHVSVALMEEFLQYAISNTRKGIESCGILAGRLLADDSTFQITTLIIPKQEGTSDTVQALNEEEIFDAQFQRELYPLGWIHTHPTQSCFLSSVDVHTQCGYQTMLDEAVAIVMAPTDPAKRCGIFRLSTPGGLSLVQKCPSRGFHTHPSTSTGQELYELCGHVFLNPRSKHEVLDLR